MTHLGQNAYWVKSPYVCVLFSPNLDRDSFDCKVRSLL
jgi:hypothetical protein